MADLKPVETPAPSPAPAPETAPTPEPTPQPVQEPGTEPQGGQQPVADKGFDKELRMSKSPSVLEEMRNITGEDPDRTYKPLITDVVVEERENEQRINQDEPGLQPQPAEKPGTEPQPKPVPGQQADGVDAGGVKFKTVDDLKKSYGELVHKLHKNNFEHKNEVRQTELEVKRLDNEKKYLEKMLQTNIVESVEGKPDPAKPKTLKRISKEEFDAALDSENSYEVINQMMDERLETIKEERAGLVTDFQKNKESLDAEHTKGVIARNIEDARSDQDMKSFADNQKAFGEWLEQTIGDDDSSLKVINGICKDYGKLKKTYRTYLKDTYDFTSAIQSAKAEGEALATQKEQLAPIQSTIKTGPGQRDPSKLKPKEDAEMLSMETSLGINRRGSFFGKDGLLR